MPFEKGHKKHGGRKKGVKSKKLQLIDDWIDHNVNDSRDEFWKRVHNLDDKDFVNAWLTMLDHVHAKKQRVEGDQNKLPSITINLIPASNAKTELADNNTLDITHEEVNRDN